MFPFLRTQSENTKKIISETLQGPDDMASGPQRGSVRYKLIIYGSSEPHFGLIAHMISWNHALFPTVQTWKWQHRASCSATLIESASA